MLSGVITAAIWGWLTTTLMQFWGWIAAGCIAILGLLFSPNLRKYTIGAIAVTILLVIVYVYGYNSNHNVELVQHTCDEFRKWLVSGPATDKAIAIFKRHDLCV